MAYIKKRKNKNGVSYQVNIRLKDKNIYQTFNRLTDAKEWAAKAENEINEGRFNRIDTKTFFEDITNEYLQKISSKKAKLTHDRENVCAKALINEFKGLLLSSITPKKISEYRDKRLLTVSKYSVRLELILLKQIFTVAIKEWGINVINSVNDVKIPSMPEGRENFLTEFQIKLLLDECKKSKNKKLFYYVLMILHSGMRPGEAAGLLRKSINLERKIFEIYKKGKRINVPMTNSLLEKIPEILKFEPDSKWIFLPKDASEYFQNYPSQYFRSSFNNAIKRAKLNLTIHDLRHTSASLLLMAGVDIRTLADILGHSTLNMVKRYTHLIDDYKQDAINKIDHIGV